MIVTSSREVIDAIIYIDLSKDGLIGVRDHLFTLLKRMATPKRKNSNFFITLNTNITDREIIPKLQQAFALLSSYWRYAHL